MGKSFAALLLALLLAAPAALAEPPLVLASIKPLHSILARVMAGAGRPELIVKGAASPHDYALKPSDMRRLKQAGLVVWVGDEFEAWLAKPLAGRAEGLAMAELPGLTIHHRRHGGVWEGDGHDHGHGHGADDPIDGHVWLDPTNATQLATAAALRLAGLDPANAPLYRDNAQALEAELAVLDGDLRTRLAPLAGRPYVVFHDAFQYFEARYGLTPAGSVTLDPERPPSARRLAALRDRLRAGGVACVFREPGYPEGAAGRLAEAAGARLGRLDPEGLALEPGPDLYPRLMSAIAESLDDCLFGSR